MLGYMLEYSRRGNYTMGKALTDVLGIDARAILAQAFEELGGIPAFIDWARGNPDKFYMVLWPKLLPREVHARHSGSVNTGRAPLIAVNVLDPRGALNALEAARDAGDTPSGLRRGGDRRPVEGGLQAYADSMPQADGSGVRTGEASGPADAAETRQDDVVSIDLTLPLPHSVSVA